MNLYAGHGRLGEPVFARLILDAGLRRRRRHRAHAMGVTSELPAVCALATGSVGITPLDQASGYQTIANGGVHCEPYAVASISRGDQLLYTHRPDCDAVLSRDVAHRSPTMMVGVVEHGDRGGAAILVRALADRRQDRDREREHERLVRRVHAPGRRRRSGWGRRACRSRWRVLRRRRLRRHGRGADLARLHGARDAGYAGRWSSRRRSRRRARSRTWSDHEQAAREQTLARGPLQGQRRDGGLVPAGGHGRRAGARPAARSRCSASPSRSTSAPASPPMVDRPEGRRAHAAEAHARACGRWTSS